MGEVVTDSFIIVSDNINRDLRPNPGENIRFKISLTNHTDFTCRNLRADLIGTLSPYIKPAKKTSSPISINEKSQSVIFLDTDYLILDIYPNAPANHEAKLIFEITDLQENIWYDTITFTILPFDFSIIDTVPQHISGEAEGKFGISLINHSLLKDNFYNIKIVKTADTKLNLVNTSIADTILKNHDLPDSLGHNMPITDGFKINIGTVTTKTGIKSRSYIPETNLWFRGATSTSILGLMYPDKSNFITKLHNPDRGTKNS